MYRIRVHVGTRIYTDSDGSVPQDKIVPFNFCKGPLKACKDLVNVVYSL